MTVWIIDFLVSMTEITYNNIHLLILFIILSLYRVAGIFQVFVCTVIAFNTTLMINDIFVNALMAFMNITSSSLLYYNLITYNLLSAAFLISDLIILALLKHFNLTLFEEGTLIFIETINNKTKYRNIIFNKYNIVIVVIVTQMWLLIMYFQIYGSTVINISSEVRSIQENFITLLISSAFIILNITVLLMVKAF